MVSGLSLQMARPAARHGAAVSEPMSQSIRQSMPSMAATPGEEDPAAVVERVLREHGREIFGWMLASLPGETEAADAFSLFSEDLWRSLSRYDGRCSMRTWCYMLARHAVSRIARAGRLGVVPGVQAVPLSQAPVSRIPAERRDVTLEHLRSEAKQKVRSLREHLDPDDLARQAALLRKRFERVKTKLRALMAGLAPVGPPEAEA
jgi:RNA polymerase sigma-70 factor (ECF subfamily)